MPRVSVIIPCYNQGATIEETVQSVLEQTYDDFEILIIDDGSTDPETVRLLDCFDRPKTRIIRTENQGLASARNNGIREALGEYLLPLDGDDRIGKTYLEQAVRILDNDPEVGIVYCLAEFFGDRSGPWGLQEFHFPEILLENVIFCASFFRKIDWERTKGFNPNMRHGLEDWDFWLSLIELGRKVVRIPEVLFYYRFRQESMIHSLPLERWVTSYSQVYRNHEGLYAAHIETLFHHLLELRQERDRAWETIAAMESSKFWKLRSTWQRLKGKFLK